MADLSTQQKIPPSGGSSYSIRIDDLNKSYSAGDRNVVILKGLSLSVPERSLSVIIGRSGSGKSTLLNLIAGLDRPDSGEIRLLGRSLPELEPEALASFRLRHVGLVFQFFNLLPTLSLSENVLLPAILAGTSKVEAKRSAGHLLERLGIGRLADRLPGQVSGGEIQRAAIARALINKPALVLADEPTGNLDEATGAELVQLFLRLSREDGVTLLVVTHDDKLINGADRRFLLEHGSVRETHDESR